MDSVPMPQILDAERIRRPERDDMTVHEHQNRAEGFRIELERSCEYGQALWSKLTEVREYLAEQTPGPDADDVQWSQWSALYGSVTSSLAGTKGDNGFGAQEATTIAQSRRSNG